MSAAKVTILLAEDDDGHATLIRRNLARTGLAAHVERLRNGQEILDWVAAGRLGSAGAVVVLLDISMPRVDGIEVLRRLKADPATRSIPIYMLTTTDNPAEVNRCFELGCNAYLTKPVAYEAFTTMVQRLCEFLEIARIPASPIYVQNVV